MCINHISVVNNIFITQLRMYIPMYINIVCIYKYKTLYNYKHEYNTVLTHIIVVV